MKTADSALNAALNFAVASYNVPDTKPVVIRRETKNLACSGKVVIREDRAPRVTRTKVESTEPINVEPSVRLVDHGKPPMPEVGSLQANGFLLMMRHAKTSEEKIFAIHAYTGYDFSDTLGNQEFLALAKAKREIHPIDASGPSRSEQREAARSLQGWVAGMPDNHGKMARDLLKREQLCAEEMARLQSLSEDESLSQEQRELNMGLAALEEERLIAIRAELTKLVG